MMGSEAYLKLRNKEITDEKIVYASDPVTTGLKAAIRVLMFDFHSLMNDEIIFLHVPRYIYNKSFNLSDEELNELDELAKLMENPNDNFEKLQDIWNNNIKFRDLAGALN